MALSNCEHFAKWCRYNDARSSQVTNAVACLAEIATGVAVELVKNVAPNLPYDPNECSRNVGNYIRGTTDNP